VKVGFHPAAARELIETSTFYDNEVPGLGERFIAEVERVVSLVAERPNIGQEIEKGRRRIVLARFPYSLIYSTESNDVWILAVAHQRRRPGYWHGRMGH
jgi:plasmid stabilization system protein ParE